MNQIQSVLITGANAGLGREAARQLAVQKGISKVYLACRNSTKAEAAKAALENETGRKIFEIVLMDVTDPASVRAAVAELSTPIDAVILNAGGTGGRHPNSLTSDGVTNIFATNVLGHVALVDALLGASVGNVHNSVCRIRSRTRHSQNGYAPPGLVRWNSRRIQINR